MNIFHKVIIGLILLTLLSIGAGVIYYEYLREEPQGNTGTPNITVNFSRTGNAVKESSGIKPGAWYLVYEVPGSPAMRVELVFPNAYADLESGERVEVEGHESGGKVTVTKLRILNAYKRNIIWVESPLPEDVVINPITLTGWARGSWYFEASFPIKVLDADGNLLGQVAAQAQGDWMTDEYVQFFASLEFTPPATATGTLVLEKDNPSGLPELASELRLPIRFGTEGRTVTLYYYNPNKDVDAGGNILCSKQGLVPVTRQIPITLTPISDTITLLLKGELTAAERAQGITTEYPLPGLALAGAMLKNNALTLEFLDPQNKTGGGSCRVSVLWAQIEATARQFPEVKAVNFKPEELFQP